MLTSCYNEGDVTPSGNYSVLRLEFPQGNNRGIKKSRTFTMFMGYIYYTKVLPPKTLIANGHPWVQENYIMGMI